MSATTKRCSVAYALRERQWLWELVVPANLTVGEVLAAARATLSPDEALAAAHIPWERATVGIFGEICARDAIPRDGDRIELYRELTADPKVRRRERARARRSVP